MENDNHADEDDDDDGSANHDDDDDGHCNDDDYDMTTTMNHVSKDDGDAGGDSGDDDDDVMMTTVMVTLTMTLMVAMVMVMDGWRICRRGQSHCRVDEDEQDKITSHAYNQIEKEQLGNSPQRQNIQAQY